MKSCGKQNQNKENFLENRLVWQDSAPEYQYPSENEDVRDWAVERHAEASGRKVALDAEMSGKGLKFEYRYRYNPWAEEEVVSDGYVDQSHVMGTDGKELPGQKALKYKMELFLSRDVLGPEIGISDVIMPGVDYFEREVSQLNAEALQKGYAGVARENMQLLVDMYDAVIDAIAWKRTSDERTNAPLTEYEDRIRRKLSDTLLVLSASTDDGLDELKKELGM